MHLVRILIGGLHHTRGGLRTVVRHRRNPPGASRAGGCVSARTRCRPLAAGPPPPSAQEARSSRRRLHGLPGFLEDHADEVLANDDANKALKIAHGRLVDARQCRVHSRRPDDGAVQHAVDAHVVHELEPPGRHRGKVEARDGRAEHGPVRDRPSASRWHRARARTSGHRPGPHSDPSRRIACDGNRAIAGRQPIGWNAQPGGRQPNQAFAGGGGG